MKQIKHYLIALLLTIMPVIGVHAQNMVVNFQTGPMTVRQAFEAIEHQLGMTIAYIETLLDVNRQVTPPSGKPVLEAMTAILEGTGMQAGIDGKIILVVKAEQKAVSQVEYKGKVVDASGPVPGAMIMLDGKKDNVAMTDIDGQFSIQATPGRTFVVSMMGYKDYSSRFGSQTAGIVINLEEDIDLLEESVVVGYGVQKKVNLTGAVGVISGKDLNNRPVTNAAQALQGADPSLLKSMSSGSIEGKQYNVKIRGQVSLNSGSPLILVDGSESSLTQVNPNDIESVSVLKDASSCAIYGATASAGVVIITTKSGAEGKVKVSFDCYGGVQNIWRTLDLMKRDEYVETMVKIGNSDAERKELKRGFTNWLSTYRLGRDYYATPETFSYETQETDWQAEVQHKNAAIQNYHISVDGGTDKIKYSLTAGYFAQDGTIKESFNNRLTLRTNASYEITKWLKLGTNLSYITSKSRSLGNNAQYNGVLFQAISMAPWDPTHYPAGTLSKSGEDISGKIAASTNYTNVYNPFTQLETSHPNNTDERLLANGYLEIKPREWLTFKSSISMNRYSWQNRSYREKYHFSAYDTNV